MVDADSSVGGFVGVYNSTFARSGCGISTGVVGNPVALEAVGNTFHSSMSRAIRLVLWEEDPHRIRIWFNTALSFVSTDGDGPVTRTQVDVRYNILAGGAGRGLLDRGLHDWSLNWWGTNINILPPCMDPAVAATSNPPINTTPSQSCPEGQEATSGFDGPGAVTPALSGSPSVLPAKVREAFAPRFGPVNSYSGALSYSTADMVVEDAGKH